MYAYTTWEPGDIVWYRLSWERDPQDRRIHLERLVRAKVVRVTGRRVVIKLMDFPQFRARSVRPDRLS